MKCLLIILLIVTFILMHLIKMMRMYLILMDSQIPLERFVPAYFRTTFVNLIIPFKLGEVYRVAVFSKLSNKITTGFLSVLVDRFFDTLAIVIILFPYQVLLSGKITLPVVLLSIFLIGIVAAYVIFPSSYTFMNRYIIMTKTSVRSLKVLKILEVMNEWYVYVKNLVSGRYGLLGILSMLAWVLELLILGGFYKIMGDIFTLKDFGRYIESIVSGSTYLIKTRYTFISAVIIMIITIITSVYCMAVRRKNVE